MRYHSHAVVIQLAAPLRPDFTRRAIKNTLAGAGGGVGGWGLGGWGGGQVRLRKAAEQINSRVEQR